MRCKRRGNAKRMSNIEQRSGADFIVLKYRPTQNSISLDASSPDELLPLVNRRELLLSTQKSSVAAADYRHFWGQNGSVFGPKDPRLDGGFSSFIFVVTALPSKKQEELRIVKGERGNALSQVRIILDEETLILANI